jgi:hypothetical protein
VFVHAEKAADAQDNVFSLAGLIDDEVLDVANFLTGTEHGLSVTVKR